MAGALLLLTSLGLSPLLLPCRPAACPLHRASALRLQLDNEYVRGDDGGAEGEDCPASRGPPAAAAAHS